MDDTADGQGKKRGAKGDPRFIQHLRWRDESREKRMMTAALREGVLPQKQSEISVSVALYLIVCYVVISIVNSVIVTRHCREAATQFTAQRTTLKIWFVSADTRKGVDVLSEWKLDDLEDEEDNCGGVEGSGVKGDDGGTAGAEQVSDLATQRATGKSTLTCPLDTWTRNS